MDGKLVVKKGREKEAICLADIVFMEKDKRKVNIHTGTETITVYGMFRDMEDELDDRFFSPHKSYMFNMEHIDKMRNGHVIMETGREISLSRGCMEKLKEAYNGYIAKIMSSGNENVPK